MIDLECMIKSLRLAWLKRIFSENEGTWKNYLRHLLVSLEGLFFQLQLCHQRLHHQFSILFRNFNLVVRVL